MKFISVLAFALLCTACSSTDKVAKSTEKPASADVAETAHQGLPTKERDFVDAIEKMDKEAIVSALGEPQKAEDVKIKGTNKIVASIWYYEHINTNDNGDYYPLTELDFIDGKVVQVVFLNDGDLNAEEKQGQSYEFPQNKTPQ